MMAFGPKITAFLAAIRVMPNVTRAAKAAGINPCSHYAKLKKSPAYRAAFNESMQIGCDAVSDVAIERATAGWEEPIVFQGEFTYPLVRDAKGKIQRSTTPLTIRKIDNRLLEFVLKNRHPDYREKKEVEAPQESAQRVSYQWVPRSSAESNTSPSLAKPGSTTAPADSRDSQGL